MAYRNTLQADALKLVAKKLQSSLAVEGELPEDGLAAFGDDGDDLMMALARKIVSGEGEDDAETVEVFAQARDAESAAEELLVDDGWKVGRGRGGGRCGQRERTPRQAIGYRPDSRACPGQRPPRQRERGQRHTAMRLPGQRERPPRRGPGAAAVAVLLGGVHGRGAGEAPRAAAASKPAPSRCSSGRSHWSKSGRSSRSARDARPLRKRGRTPQSRCPPPALSMYAGLFAFQQGYARVRPVQRGLTDVGAPQELR